MKEYLFYILIETKINLWIIYKIFFGIKNQRIRLHCISDIVETIVEENLISMVVEAVVGKVEDMMDGE